MPSRSTPKLNMVQLLDQLNGFTEEELVELQRLITHLVGLKRSVGVLRGELERPGKRGKRWVKPTQKKEE